MRSKARKKREGDTHTIEVLRQTKYLERWSQLNHAPQRWNQSRHCDMKGRGSKQRDTTRYYNVDIYLIIKRSRSTRHYPWESRHGAHTLSTVQTMLGRYLRRKIILGTRPENFWDRLMVFADAESLSTYLTFWAVCQVPNDAREWG